MGKMLFRLRLLMQNRYGTDQLNLALMLLYLILVVLRIAFIRVTLVRRILMLISWAVLIFAFGRMFSTNIEKRSRENNAFLSLLSRAGSANITNPFENMTGGSNAGFSGFQKREKDKKYVRCPQCKATLRVPRQKGKHTVRCPRCDHRFQIRIVFGAKK